MSRQIGIQTKNVLTDSFQSENIELAFQVAFCYVSTINLVIIDLLKEFSGGVAQLAEQRPFKPWVEGSSPSALIFSCGKNEF